MDALKKNLTDLGTKLKDGAADFAQKHEGEINAAKAKAEELKAMAEGALGGGGSSNKTSEETTEEKASIISNWTPGINVQEGSIADILFKAKASSGVEGAETAETAEAPAEPEEPVAAIAEDETSPKESYPGDVAMEEIQKEVNEIAARIEAFGSDVKDNEEVQKVLVPLLTKLSLAQEKFVSASEQAAEEPTEEEAVEENDEGKLPSHYAGNDLKYQAEKAAKKALEDAEAIAKAVAVKIGILEAPGGEEIDGADETEAAPEEEK